MVFDPYNTELVFSWPYKVSAQHFVNWVLGQWVALEEPASLHLIEKLALEIYKNPLVVFYLFVFSSPPN